MPRTVRAVEQRKALGRRIRAYRLALGLASRDVATHIGTSHSQMTSIETVCQDVLVGTLVDVAEAVGLNVVLAAEHHLPLLDLTADEVDAITEVLTDCVRYAEAETFEAVAGANINTLRSALDKLTTSTEETP